MTTPKNDNDDRLRKQMIEMINRAISNSKTASPHKKSALPSHRDQLLDQLPEASQVEILRWAEQHGIRQDDPMWLLVDLLGYTQSMTSTLPSQMRAAARFAIDAIAQQRQAECDLFSESAQKFMETTMSAITDRAIQASAEISDSKIKTRLWIHGLWVGAGIIGLATMCFLFGYLLANANVPWVGTPADNHILFLLQTFLRLPIGYLILPMVVSGVMIFFIDRFRRWRCGRAAKIASAYGRNSWF
ncbi:MAG TPA: hypothetical protein DCZ48_12485 [Methylococcaceae bacterium]|nr:hypothetical protein [Methylococcaceae bacterium]